jgi:hypothetical protein
MEYEEANVRTMVLWRNGKQRAKVERHIVICISMVSLFRLVLTYRIWATLSTIKRCIQRTWGLIEVRSLPSRELFALV